MLTFRVLIINSHIDSHRRHIPHTQPSMCINSYVRPIRFVNFFITLRTVIDKYAQLIYSSIVLNVPINSSTS
jgi:hypothetical protein